MQSNKDDEIIRLVSEYGLLTHGHVTALTKRHPKAIWRSLPRLVKRRLLYCREQGMYKPNVYSTFDIRRRENLRHDLMISDVHVTLTKTHKLLEWRQARGKVKDGLNEDAWFQISVPVQGRSGRISYYLEADAGTEPNWMIEDKYRRYLQRREDERFNVLFVVTDEKRARSLARCAERFVDGDKPSTWKLFLSTTLEEIKTDALGTICHTAYTDEKFPIVPDLRR